MKNATTWVLASVSLNALLTFGILPWGADQIGLLYNFNRFPDNYQLLAESLADGQGLRFYSETAETIIRPPGYPLVLAGLFTLFGESLLAAKVLNFILLLITAGLVMRIARSELPDYPRVQFLAPIIVLLYPGMLIAQTRGGVEVLLALAITAFLFVLLAAIRHGSALLYFAAGLLLGMGTLVKSTPILFPALLLPYLVYTLRRQPSFRSLVILPMLLVLGAVLVLSPWMYRNHQLVGSPIPTMTVLGVAITQGQYMCDNISPREGTGALAKKATHRVEEIAVSHGYDFYKVNTCCGPFFYDARDELAFSKQLKQQALTRYIDDPIYLARCATLNFANFWLAGRNHASTLINSGVQIPLVLLTLYGTFLLWRRRQLGVLTVLLVFVLYYMAVHLPILALARHSIPLVPLLALFSSIGLLRLWDKWTGRPEH